MSVSVEGAQFTRFAEKVEKITSGDGEETVKMVAMQALTTEAVQSTPRLDERSRYMSRFMKSLATTGLEPKKKAEMFGEVVFEILRPELTPEKPIEDRSFSRRVSKFFAPLRDVLAIPRRHPKPLI